MKKIYTDELHRQLKQGPVALFDVRGDVLYEQGHIPGAKTAPLGSLGFRVNSTMNKDSYVVLYDDGGESMLAAQGVERLEGLGMTNIHIYSEGLTGWREAGLGYVESPNAKLHTQGPVKNCRALLVDRENSYGGAFRSTNMDVAGAGG